MSKITIRDMIAIGNGLGGISVPGEGVELDVEGYYARDNGGPALEVRDSPSVRAILGLRDDAPATEIEALVRALNATPPSSAAEVAGRFEAMTTWFRQGESLLRWSERIYALASKPEATALFAWVLQRVHGG